MVYPALLRYTIGIYLVIVGLWAIIARLLSAVVSE